jgi:hypothetical protein
LSASRVGEENPRQTKKYRDRRRESDEVERHTKRR